MTDRGRESTLLYIHNFDCESELFSVPLQTKIVYIKSNSRYFRMFCQKIIPPIKRQNNNLNFFVQMFLRQCVTTISFWKSRINLQWIWNTTAVGSCNHKRIKFLSPRNQKIYLFESVCTYLFSLTLNDKIWQETSLHNTSNEINKHVGSFIILLPGARVTLFSKNIEFPWKTKLLLLRQNVPVWGVWLYLLLKFLQNIKYLRESD